MTGELRRGAAGLTGPAAVLPKPGVPAASPARSLPSFGAGGGTAVSLSSRARFSLRPAQGTGVHLCFHPGEAPAGPGPSVRDPGPPGGAAQGLFPPR